LLLSVTGQFCTWVRILPFALNFGVIGNKKKTQRNCEIITVFFQ
jgi:hypothetical protein